jgi:AcrR family transcriptional regulator
MPRVSKEPEKRKQDLIEAAKRLFMTKGYEQTAVSDIVKELNVAQGTFYYHFRSKAEILEEVVKGFVFSLVERARFAAERDDIDAVARLNKFFDTLARFGTVNNELIDFIHQETNLPIHDKLAKITMAKVVPLLSKIIRDGTAEGAFKITYPVETAMFLLLAIGEIFHDPGVINDPEKIKRVRITVEQCVARALGMKEGSFRLNF